MGTFFDYPRFLCWTGWSVRFSGCRARRNDAEWSFHSLLKELQRRHAPGKPCNPARSVLTKRVHAKHMIKPFRTNMLHILASGQQRNLGLSLQRCRSHHYFRRPDPGQPRRSRLQPQPFSAIGLTRKAKPSLRRYPLLLSRCARHAPRQWPGNWQAPSRCSRFWW